MNIAEATRVRGVGFGQVTTPTALVLDLIWLKRKKCDLPDNSLHRNDLTWQVKKKKKYWIIWVSIPVPRPCEGRALPIAPITHASSWRADKTIPKKKKFEKKKKKLSSSRFFFFFSLMSALAGYKHLKVAFQGQSTVIFSKRRKISSIWTDPCGKLINELKLVCICSVTMQVSAMGSYIIWGFVRGTRIAAMLSFSFLVDRLGRE